MNSFLKIKPRRLVVGVWVLLWLLGSLTGPLVHAQTTGPTYTVQEGDTLFSIARSFGVTVEALQEANNITDPSLLAIGQTLIIPGYEGIEGSLVTYRVQLGETLTGLAKRFGTSEADLIRINRLTNSEALFVGQSLVYPDGGQGLAAGRTVVTAETESLYAIAAQYNLSPWALVLVNDLDSPIAAYAGQPVIVPADSQTGPALSGLPEPFETLTLSPGRPIQGGTLEIAARVNDGVTLEGQFNNWQLHFAPDPVATTSTRLIALQGINAFTEPGLYPLTLKATAADGTVSTFEQLVPVASGDYPSQAIYVGPEQSALLDPNVVNPEREQILQIVSAFTPIKFWDGVFLKPVPTDRITTGFGWRRSYNGGPYDSYHDGIDYGAPGGTIITAPANGTVVFSGPLQVRGNVTIIDHGWGVYSSYWHQYKIYVQVGQVVQMGEAIGEVGSSGLSTGSHLHFSMWVGDNAVDPQQWQTTVFP
jgi:murein DD-endopeptidase MepM/ murein hydrolase activator NlpD